MVSRCASPALRPLKLATPFCDRWATVPILFLCASSMAAVMISGRLVAAIEELDAVDVVGGGPAHPLARLLRRRHRPVRPARAERLVVEDARRGDLVLRRAVLLGAAHRGRRQRHAADRGHAVRQPQLVGVAQVRRLAAASSRARACRRSPASRTCPCRRSRSRHRAARDSACCGMPGQPAWRTAVILLPSMTMSIGLSGGPPVPSISVTLRITIFLKGPVPSPCLRAGAALSPACRRGHRVPAPVPGQPAWAPERARFRCSRPPGPASPRRRRRRCVLCGS